MIRLEITEYTREIRREIGNRIRAKRMEKGLTAADVAAYLDVSITQVYRIEGGKANCTVAALYVLAQLLECSADCFLFGDETQVKLMKEQQEAIAHFLSVFTADSSLKDTKNKKNKSF